MPSASNSPDACPTDIDEVAEAYIMERLAPADTLLFEDHFITCRQCAEAAGETEWFVRAMKAAMQRLNAEPPR